MEVIEPIDRMQEICESLRNGGKCIRLVPTMGALHAGHGSLIREARGVKTGGQSNNNNEHDESLVVIVSIFVNPTQFNNQADFQNYPSTLDDDLRMCKSWGVDFVFKPKCCDIYPNALEPRDDANQCRVLPPDELANQLEGASRLGHFEGVLTIVCKLFNIIRPHEAYFGEKDYQQLILVDKMVRDLNMSVKVKPVATVRDEVDMLPLSSRNCRLNAQERRLASLIHTILEQAKDALKTISTYDRNHNNGDVTISVNGNSIHDMKLNAVLMGSMLTTISMNLQKSEDKIFKFDYLEIRCAHDLSQIRFNDKLGAYDCQRGCLQTRLSNTNNDNNWQPNCSPADKLLKTRLLASVVVGGVRLLDNIEVMLN